MTEHTGGLRAAVLTGPYGDCSNGGISSRWKHVTVVGEDLPERHKVRTQAPAVRLIETAPGYVVAVPVDQPRDTVGPMASGAYIVVQYDLDGARDWRDHLGVTFSAAIPLHDRFETPEQYEALSR